MRKYLICLSVGLCFGSLLAAAQPNVIHGENLFKPEELSVSSENKKGLVLVFLSAKCPCSNSHVQELKNLSKEYSNFSFVAVHSNADESKDLAKPYFEKIALPFPVIEDKNAVLADQYHALKTPHVFVLTGAGVLAYQGGVSSSKDFDRADRKYLREALVDLQNDRPVKTPEGRTLGCIISRGEKNVW